MNFLESLYLEGICPQEQSRIYENPEYKDICSALHTLEERLYEKLDYNAKSAYINLKNENVKAHALELAHAFAYGFKLGGRIAFEVVNDKD